jgi:hypothetical protein
VSPLSDYAASEVGFLYLYVVLATNLHMQSQRETQGFFLRLFSTGRPDFDASQRLTSGVVLLDSTRLLSRPSSLLNLTTLLHTA